jgi:hypothetical protein
MNHQIFQEILQDAQSDPSLQSTLNIRELLETNAQIEITEKGETLQTIAQNVFNGLHAFHLDKDTLADYCAKLSDYCIIEEFHELVVGRYIRWIRRIPSVPTDPVCVNNILNRGGVLVNIFFKDDGVFLQVKPCNTPFAMKLKYDNFVIFQKRTADEQLLMILLEPTVRGRSPQQLRSTSSKTTEIFRSKTSLG